MASGGSKLEFLNKFQAKNRPAGEGCLPDIFGDHNSRYMVSKSPAILGQNMRRSGNRISKAHCQTSNAFLVRWGCFIRFPEKEFTEDPWNVSKAKNTLPSRSRNGSFDICYMNGKNGNPQVALVRWNYLAKLVDDFQRFKIVKNLCETPILVTIFNTEVQNWKIQKLYHPTNGHQLQLPIRFRWIRDTTKDRRL